MTDQNDIERYCRNCVSRDFVNGRGLVCKRTGAIPAFVGECESYQKDEELEKMAPTPKPEDYSGYVDREKLLAEENLPKAVLFGVLACIAGAVAWALTAVTGRTVAVYNMERLRFRYPLRYIPIFRKWNSSLTENP